MQPDNSCRNGDLIDDVKSLIKALELMVENISPSSITRNRACHMLESFMSASRGLDVKLEPEGAALYLKVHTVGLIRRMVFPHHAGIKYGCNMSKEEASLLNIGLILKRNDLEIRSLLMQATEIAGIDHFKSHINKALTYLVELQKLKKDLIT